MNLLIVSNNEVNSFYMICYCVLQFPNNINWKILGNAKYHEKFISVFGKEKFIDTAIFPLHHHLQDHNTPFAFLNELAENSVIIPSDFEGLRFLSKNKNAFPDHKICPLLEESLLDYLDNKANQLKIAHDCDFLAPKEYLYSQLKDMPADKRLVIKPKLSSASYGVFISQNLQQAIDYYQSLTLENQEKQIIQDYINGDEHFYYAICDNGRLAISAARKETHHLGRLVLITFVNPAPFNKTAEKIARYYQYNGPVSLDFIICKESKEIYLMEINPRNGSGSYSLNAENINWILELAKFTDHPNNYNGTDNADIEKAWICSWKGFLLYLLANPKLATVKILIDAIPIQIIPNIKIKIKKLICFCTKYLKQ